jgi:putative oxidoreductase
MRRYLLSSAALHADLALLILRVFFGLAMAFSHGWGKLMKMFTQDFNDLTIAGMGATAFVLAVFAEFLCSVFLALGLFTRLVLIPLIITMCVAAFYQHWSDPFGKKEMSLMYLVVFIVLYITGPGKYALDRWRKARL